MRLSIFESQGHSLYAFCKTSHCSNNNQNRLQIWKNLCTQHGAKGRRRRRYRELSTFISFSTFLRSFISSFISVPSYLNFSTVYNNNLPLSVSEFTCKGTIQQGKMDTQSLTTLQLVGIGRRCSWWVDLTVAVTSIAFEGLQLPAQKSIFRFENVLLTVGIFFGKLGDFGEMVHMLLQMIFSLVQSFNLNPQKTHVVLHLRHDKVLLIQPFLYSLVHQCMYLNNEDNKLMKIYKTLSSLHVRKHDPTSSECFCL